MIVKTVLPSLRGNGTRPRMRPLDFQPSKSWSDLLPPVCWKGWVIAGFQNPQPPVELSTSSLGEALRVCYPELSLMERARLWEIIQREDNAWQWMKEICRNFEARWDSEELALLEKLRQLPAPFQDWIQSQKLNSREVMGLVQIPMNDELKTLLVEIATSQATRSEGVKILDLALELLELDTPASVLHRPQGPANSEWIKKLWALRYPMASQKDEHRRQLLSKVHWPRGVKAQWLRMGDDAGVEFRFFFHSPAQLAKFLEESRDLPQEVIPLFETASDLSSKIEAPK